MALPQVKPYLTPEEYLRLERQAKTKSQYWEGEVYAMAGVSRIHNTIAANVIISLGGQLKRRPCAVYPSDMRVKVQPTGLYTYPDVVVVCGKAQFEDRRQDTLLNPTLIVEVLSPTSEVYDRGVKFGHYRALATLSDYLLISQSSPTIEHYVRQPDDRWLLSTYAGLDAVAPLAAIGCELCLADIYDKVEWPEPTETAVILRLVKEQQAEYLPC